jgi:1-deoxy-D-xylulose 5-phosphate reductoisomerase
LKIWRETFPKLKLAYKFIRLNNSFKTVYKILNELIVNAFIDEYINYLIIEYLIEKFVLKSQEFENSTFDKIIKIDIEF